MEKQVLCFGEVLWDAFGDEKKPGGAPMNVAMHLLKQGVNSVMLSRLGNDASGHELAAFLKQNNLYSGLIQLDDKLPTCEVTVQLDAHQQATYIIPQPVSWDNIQIDEIVEQQISQTSAIVFGSLACRSQTSRETLLGLLKYPALKIFDVNLRPPHYELSTIQTLAAMADVVKMNEEEADLLIGDHHTSLKDKMLEFQQKYHTQIICVTRGGNGAIIWNGGQFYEHAGFKVNVVDTVGAGDSFLATFITGLLHQQPMEAVLERACAVGALVAGSRGANPDYTPEQISAIINNQTTKQL